ncbi:MAG: bifunctional riboflavin kinase/FMN adenylyltransferase [Ferrovum sp. 37-45-19]|uniref:bifunctional riboflavin kinase/FAD synthetase n=1 Tax=Ferrovum sp. JA12 TaxID=1356299 RepID=UPI000703C169|nr:bifunctional riboflavin kinase/FAD synthetase [Ferrovum sp. JA12]OYV78927.1 MAG: bifunctional riboflavin kinase/FMN adenylyltransferase [Ferrovum sp. 21-44-67]OYV94908.1 MAG: bifunctional riboflavin kinase/FMN adenylyltransferase [Ferrovum sp. 37-45-19]HQT82302.1 bifunctional riboflavin kinase/FAD synthetase [Ferrovaceae bacterium]KRH79321.1 riboflavin biosynthesis protein RibF [Ferrovum sp. JA12]HQU06830.1 bifunctional riboflavin kinase/FAD synthetase [Ferrovaceae bacterium]
MHIHLGLSQPLTNFCALTIGNFDGVHLGHQMMIEQVVTQARARHLDSVVMTFEPHPKDFFAPQFSQPRLTSLREKIELLEAVNVDHVVILRFNHDLANTSAEEFVNRILNQQLHTRYLLVGDDFRFGAKRQGDFAYLATRSKESGFICESMNSHKVGQERVSSSAIREALQHGLLDTARKLLGRPFFISGRVAFGKQLGRTIGYPTANIPLGRRIPPLQGIFAVTVEGLNKESLKGVASLGTRPSVESNHEPWLEVHLFNFNETIYGQRIHVNFYHKIRDEAEFTTLDALIKQIDSDAEQAKAYFTSHTL